MPTTRRPTPTFEVPTTMSGFMRNIHNRNVGAAEILADETITDWTVWTQDGPSDDTMLVSREANFAVCQDDLFGYRPWTMEIDMLPKCGWIELGPL